MFAFIYNSYLLFVFRQGKSNAPLRLLFARPCCAQGLYSIWLRCLAAIYIQPTVAGGNIKQRTADHTAAAAKGAGATADPSAAGCALVATFIQFWTHCFPAGKTLLPYRSGRIEWPGQTPALAAVTAHR